MKKRILSILLCFCMALALLPTAALAADPTPVTELWVGTTQVVQSGGTVTADTSGTGWSYDSATATLTLNGSNITTAGKKIVPEGWYYSLYCNGDLNIVVAGNSTIDVSTATDRSAGICVEGNLSVSGSAELTAIGNRWGVSVTENLILSQAVTLKGFAGQSTYNYPVGVLVSGSITASDTSSLTGRAYTARDNYGMQCDGNITVGSDATLTAIADDGYSDTNAVSYGLRASNGQISVDGTLLASAGDAGDHGTARGLHLNNADLVVSGNGSVRAESGASPDSTTSYGVSANGNAEITVNGGGFLASGGTRAVDPATTGVTINGTPVYYEVSANRDGSGATVCADAATWNSTYNGNFGAYKYINATTVYEVYINGTQVTRVNRNDVLGDGTVAFTPASGASSAQLTLSNASLTTVKLDGNTAFVVAGANTIGTVANAGAVTVSGGGGLTLSGSLDCGSKSLTVESGAALTTQGTVTAGEVVNGGTLLNDGTLILPEATTVQQIQTMNLTGDGIVKAGSRVYLDGILYADGGDKSSSGIDLSTLPTEGTYYKVGGGYAIFTPATTDPAANAKLELHNAVISTTNATAISLPATEPVDIIVVSDSSLTGGGNGNVINISGQALSVTGGGALTLAGPFFGINVSGGGAVSINITGNLTFDTVYQPISTSGNIAVSAKSITTKSGYYFYSGSGAVSLTATDGDIVFDETGKTNKSNKISASQSITLDAPKGKIDIAHSYSDYALTSSSGTVTVTAQNDVTIHAANGSGITSSGAVSVTSQSGSIQMDCGDYYQCVSAGGAVTLSAAEDITMSGSGTSSTAIRAGNQIVNITTGGKLTSTSAYGFQTGALTVKANEVSIEGTTQDGIQATSVSITNPTGGNCKRVSVTAASDDAYWAAIRALGNETTGNIIVKADDLFICGKGSAKAISGLGTVTIGDAGLIAGVISAGTDSIDSRIIRAAYAGDVSTSGLDISTPPTETKTKLYTAGNGYILWNPTAATVTLHSASIDNASGSALSLPHGINTTIVVEGVNSLQASQYAISNTNGNIAIQGNGTLSANGNDGGLFAKQITVTGSARVTINGIDNVNENETSVTVSGSAVLNSTKSIHTGSYRQSGSAAVTVNGQSSPGISAKNGISIDGGSLTATSQVAALLSDEGITLGSGMAVLTPSGGKIASANYTLEGVNKTSTSVIPAGAAAFTVDVVGTALSSNGATNVAIGTPPITPGSGEGGASSNTVTVPVTGGSGTVAISASVSGNTASVSATDAQLKEIASGTQADGRVKIDLSGLKVAAAVIPEKLVSAADDLNGATSIEVVLPTGTVTLDKEALSSIRGKGDIKLSVETVSTTALTDSQKAVLGNNASTAIVVDVNVYLNGIKTSTFGDGKIQVSVPYTLKPGENADSVTVWFVKDDGMIEPKTASYSNGKVTFTTEHLSQYLIVNFPFTDVAEDAWYYNSVAYSYNNGLFSGTSSTNFSPDTAMTRQMIWMVLTRMDGKTPADMEQARAWAMGNGISDGSDPASSISREQMAAILYRYAQYKKYDTTQGGMAIREFADYDSISEYALPALGWSVNAGLMQGSDNNLMPSGSATRAQVATIFHRFCQNVVK